MSDPRPDEIDGATAAFRRTFRRGVPAGSPSTTTSQPGRGQAVTDASAFEPLTRALFDAGEYDAAQLIDEPPGGYSLMRSGEFVSDPFIPEVTQGRYPFYEMVPKGLGDNIAFRRAMFRAGAASEDAAEILRRMCREDALFWINVFVWTIDPRTTKGSTEAQDKWSAKPFITWAFQDYCLEKMQDWLGECDIHWDKSRDMGASWMILMSMLHPWWFEADQKFLCASWKFELVDDRNNEDSLFPKIDFLMKYTPEWLRPRYERKIGQFYNADTNSTIDAEATVSDIGRAGRRRAIFLDEFAFYEQQDQVLSATADSTNCRIMCSTPNGEGNEFAKHRRIVAARLQTHWTLHPRKRRGMYLGENGKVRSPWYDKECRRRGSPARVAQELDINYLGSGSVFFSLEKVEHEKVRSPVEVGELEVEPGGRPKPIMFKADPQRRGRLALWCALGADGGPSHQRRYVIGADISWGTGSSNSVAQVIDCGLREQVAEFATPFLRPEQFARAVYSLAWWFQGPDGEPAMVNFENGGGGSVFASKLLEMGFRNIYWARDEKGTRRKVKVARVPGFAANADSKDDLLGELHSALSDGRLVVRSRLVYAEAKTYQYQENGHVESTKCLESDPSGAKKNHGDRVMAVALGWHLAKNEAPCGSEQDKAKLEADPPVGSFAWRMKNSQPVAPGWREATGLDPIRRRP